VFQVGQVLQPQLRRHREGRHRTLKQDLGAGRAGRGRWEKGACVRVCVRWW
jgi:hypothetical protein